MLMRERFLGWGALSRWIPWKGLSPQAASDKNTRRIEQNVETASSSTAKASIPTTELCSEYFRLLRKRSARPYAVLFSLVRQTTEGWLPFGFSKSSALTNIATRHSKWSHITRLWLNKHFVLERIFRLVEELVFGHLPATSSCQTTNISLLHKVWVVIRRLTSSKDEQVPH